MATPYWVTREDEVPSTQDRARELLDELPVLVVAARQGAGRGRSGAGWLNAPRAMAASVACHRSEEDQRPFSLMAGVAATRAVGSAVSLKWPNDVMIGELKIGGILVERSGSEMVVGLGLNLFWPDPPHGVGSLFADDPGPGTRDLLAGLWAAELLDLIDGGGWPVDEYRGRCSTLGRDIVWEPEGSGRAVGVADSGELVVESGSGTITIGSGSVRHVRG